MVSCTFLLSFHFVSLYFLFSLFFFFSLVFTFTSRDMALVEGLCNKFIYHCENEGCCKEFKRKGDFDRRIKTNEIIHR